jgi:hypothetical protein
MAIRIGSRIVMKSKAAIKGTVLKATGKYTWDIKWDDGKIRAPYKSQQVKEAATDAPPASITTTQGKCRICLLLIVEDQFRSYALSLFSSCLNKVMQ